MDRLIQEINAGHPVIVNVKGKLGDWHYSKGHFLVVKGYSDTHIICNDPVRSQEEVANITLTASFQLLWLLQVVLW